MRRLASLAQDPGEQVVVRQVLGAELIAALGCDQAHVQVVTAGRPSHATVVLRNAGSDEYVVTTGPVQTAIEWVIESGAPAIVPDARAAGLPPELVTTYGMACAALLPIRSGGVTRAVAICGHRLPRPWSAEDLEVAQALVEVAANAYAVHDAREATRIDPLTGCLNHGAMLNRLAEEIARGRRQGTPLACLLLDLDNFKMVNDRHGHPTGDALLRHVAESLRSEVRSFDQVARYGGDEFLVILPNAMGPRAEIAANRALRLLRGIHLEHPDGSVEGITVSVGVAQWDEGETVGDLLAKADLALRAGKAAGKDRLGFATSGHTAGARDAISV